MKPSVNDYFVGESLEYIDRLTALLEGEGSLDGDTVVRLAAAVRGCTRMAGADRLAALTEQLEAGARALHAGSGEGSAERRDLTLRTARELGSLLRALEGWGPDDERRLAEVTESWKPADAPPVPISDLFYDDEGPHILDDDDDDEAAGGAEEEHEDADEDSRPVVPVSDLFFRGEGALQEALSLRPRVEAAFAGSENDRERAELLDELFDLIELGLTSEADGG